jgi:hypothetical protein
VSAECMEQEAERHQTRGMATTSMVSHPDTSSPSEDVRFEDGFYLWLVPDGWSELPAIFQQFCDFRREIGQDTVAAGAFEAEHGFHDGAIMI